MNLASMGIGCIFVLFADSSLGGQLLGENCSELNNADRNGHHEALLNLTHGSLTYGMDTS
jgi:hypothetical protein